MNFDETCKEDTKEELSQMKTWLFQENVRLIHLGNELEKARQELEKEKQHFSEETSSIARKQEFERRRQKEENRFFEKKLKILQNAFLQLDADRKLFQREMDLFEAKKAVYHEKDSFSGKNDVAGILFRGVNSYMALKKRYKDLMKMYHPDNVAGDQEMVQLINREYAEIKKAYEVGRERQA